MHLRASQAELRCAPYANWKLRLIRFVLSGILPNLPARYGVKALCEGAEGIPTRDRPRPSRLPAGCDEGRRCSAPLRCYAANPALQFEPRLPPAPAGVCFLYALWCLGSARASELMSLREYLAEVAAELLVR